MVQYVGYPFLTLDSQLCVWLITDKPKHIQNFPYPIYAVCSTLWCDKQIDHIKIEEKSSFKYTSSISNMILAQ